jgi:hypothetical protein
MHKLELFKIEMIRKIESRLPGILDGQTHLAEMNKKPEILYRMLEQGGWIAKGRGEGRLLHG